MSRPIRFAIAFFAAMLAADTVLAQARSAAGAYLAGRQAIRDSDYASAAMFYTQALARDRGNADLMEETVLAQLYLGRVDRALPIARIMEERSLRSQAAHMATVVDLLQRENYEGYLARDPETQGIVPLVDMLLEAWSLFGVGDVEAGIAAFDNVAEQAGLKGFATYHKALALAVSGDFEAAAGIFENDEEAAALQTRRGVMARAEILSQLGSNEDALAILRNAFGEATDNELTAMTTALEAGETLPFTHATSVSDGVAEVFYSVAGALQNEAGANYSLLFGRLARYMRPNHVDATLLNAELLEELGQYDLAIAEYKGVSASHPAFHAAELGRVAALRESGKPDAAIEALEQLANRFPELPVVHSTLGDVLRQQEDYADAIGSYDRALELTGDTAQSVWFLLYARAISYERLGRWDEAEADFRKALALNPGQPQVLNYLGYSLVEKQINLEEALRMIEEAVAGSPDSGYIVDSLGWVLYRLGRYDEAVVQMERAVELMPIDPVVNDHLGDVYWAVGRFREAEFQWSRALSFVDEDDPGEADPVRIRRKLNVGLDTVLAEEGAPPLKVANDDG
ncbi:MAG: tetratricopeptide repeat protein [Pseudomonadota bacterium]